MKSNPLGTDLQNYCQASSVIDFNHPEIIPLAKQIAEKQPSDIGVAKFSFEWVRGNIKHSLDCKINPITCIASDVLQHKTRYCYAKSHLLAALQCS